ncbi:MAG: hemerythrin domain-containing protein [Desulfobacterales bacterium]|nr:MAG: hemerythrin domain-containing protein [Desulfobacterales bacterium]
MNPIEELKTEHQAVKLTLKILNKINQKIEGTGKPANPDHMEQLLEFFSVFVDTCHHGKEEDMLFPAMEQIGFSKDNGPIGILLYEHQVGRTYVDSMKNALSDCKKGNDKALKKFVQNAKCYIALLNGHIDKEDNVLFPLAENNLSKEKQAELYEGFEKIEVERIGVGKHDEFHKLLDQLVKIYLKEDEVDLENSEAACQLA